MRRGGEGGCGMRVTGRGALIWVVACGLAALVVAPVGAAEGPEDVALAYLRAIYARDMSAAYGMLAAADRALKSREAFAREQGTFTGFAREVARELAEGIEASRIERVEGDGRLRIRLRTRLPDANAPALLPVVRDWEESALDAMGPAERVAALARIRDLFVAGRMPMLEGEETLTLVRDADGWRVLLDWAGGVRVRFRVEIPTDIPLAGAFEQDEAMASRGGPVSLKLRVTNPTDREVRVRARHLVSPPAMQERVEVVQCSFLLPVTLGPRLSDEYPVVYFVGDIPPDVKEITVTLALYRLD